MNIWKSYKYRIYPNMNTVTKLEWMLDRCRELYNAALAERRNSYEMRIKRHPNYYDPGIRKELTKVHAIGYYDQVSMLPAIKETRPEYQEIGAHVLQDVLHRLDKVFTKFFERIRSGKKAGFPRFKGRNRYNSFTYPDKAGWKLDQQTRPSDKKGRIRVNLKLSKIGTVKLHLHRDIIGKIKTLTITQEREHWYACFSCIQESPDPLPISDECVGVDLGITHFAALSTGDFLESPKYYRRAEKKIARLQQALSRKQHDSHRRTKAVKALAKARRKVRNQRTDFLHKQSSQLIKRYQIIAFENLPVANLLKRPQPKQEEGTGQYLPNGAAAKASLNKSISDASWSRFVQLCTYKAAWAGRTLVQVDPRYTSQICSGCGKVTKKDLSERWHSCACGCELDRDTNAAINILYAAYKQLSVGTRPTLATT